jgi:lysyl-tRNA synthetase class 2
LVITFSQFEPSASWQHLRLRAELLARLRKFFAERDFLEVETPLLAGDVVIERHIEPFRTTLAPNARRPDDGQELFLQSSPEAAMKRLLASGGEAIYQITRSLRNGEQGRLHNPEFTLVEWYRRGDSMVAGIELLSDLCQALLERGTAERISYREAFQRYTGVDPFRDEIEQLAKVARANGAGAIHPAVSDRDDWLNLLLVERVEPNLGHDVPCIVYDYPASQAALATVREEEFPVAERFELYVCGVEVANGYHELTSADELRRRNRLTNAQRAADGRPVLPEESRLLAAMEHGLPESTGVALGFDRLVMLAAGARSIAEVMAFPIDRA